METYAYYYTEDDGNTSANTETAAEKGIRLALKNKDEIKDDVKFKIAMLYYDEVKDYSAAKNISIWLMRARTSRISKAGKVLRCDM